MWGRGKVWTISFNKYLIKWCQRKNISQLIAFGKSDYPFPKSNELRNIFSLAPIDQILVETDSPYLAPPPHRGKRNEPAYVTLTAQKGAEIFNLDYKDFASRVERNFEELFSKAKSFRPAA